MAKRLTRKQAIARRKPIFPCAVRLFQRFKRAIIPPGPLKTAYSAAICARHSRRPHARARGHEKSRDSPGLFLLFRFSIHAAPVFIRIAATMAIKPVKVHPPTIGTNAIGVIFGPLASLHSSFRRTTIFRADQRRPQQIGGGCARCPRPGLARRAGVARRGRARRAWLRPGRYTVRRFHIIAASSRARRISSATPKSTSRRAPS